MVLKNKTPLVLAILVIAAMAIGTIVVRNAGVAVPENSVGPPVAKDVPATTGAMGAPVRPNADNRPGDTDDRLQNSIARRQAAREESIKRSADLKSKALATFQGESVDPKWAPQKETELNGIASRPAFETAGVVPKDLRIDCKSSMCRLDGSFANNGQAEDWILLYMSSVGSAMPNSIVSRNQNPDGTTSVEIYGRAR